jgi:hypothetical protein
MRPRLRTLFLGSVLSAALSVIATPLLRRVRRVAAAGGGDPRAAARRGVAAFAGTPCSREASVAGAGDATARDER